VVRHAVTSHRQISGNAVTSAFTAIHPVLNRNQRRYHVKKFCNCDYYCGPTFKTDNRLLMSIRGYLLVVLLSFSRQTVIPFTSFPV
jgi:hypothetical protein